jgi:hypothetical protein
MEMLERVVDVFGRSGSNYHVKYYENVVATSARHGYMFIWGPKPTSSVYKVRLL